MLGILIDAVKILRDTYKLQNKFDYSVILFCSLILYSIP